MRSFRSIHNRLFLLLLVGMLALVLITTYLYYQRATEQIRTKVSDIAEKNMSQTAGLFDLLLKSYDSVTKSLNSNTELIRLLQDRGNKDNPVVQVNNDQRITDTLGAIFYSRDDIVGIHIVTYSGRVYSYERSMGGMVREYAETAWFRILRQSSGEMKWLGVYPQSLMSGGFDKPVFAFGRQLFELTELKQIGIVLIETDASAIISALSNASLGADSIVAIRDEHGMEIISTAQGGEKTGIPQNWPSTARIDGIRIQEMNGFLLTAAPIQKPEWTLISQTPMSDMQLELKKTRQYLMSVVIGVIIGATFLAGFISRTFSLPFKRLIRQMKQVEMGNFHGEVKAGSYEEINVLVASFNRMVGRIDELIERIKLASISEKNAQLQALQTQVNPHFLFNTLDMIYWMLDERENDRLGRVILALSRMFRYNSEWEEGASSTLGNELEQMRNYLTIIETRLGERLHVNISVQPQHLDSKIPKMTLQPIIENAVKYGLEPMAQSGTLHVYSEECDDRLLLIVKDDGVGMDAATLERLSAILLPGRSESENELEPLMKVMEQDEGLAASRRGIGLFNVDQRLRLMFGEPYGLILHSESGQGTKVIVVMPKSETRGAEV